MDWLKGFLKDNLLLAGILAGIGLAFLMPGPGRVLAGLYMGPLLIGLIFFFQGVAFKPSQMPRGKQLWRLMAWGLILSQLIAPLMGWAAVRIGAWPESEAVGFLLMCCMAPTLVSGAVLADKAKGDWASALLLAVGINLIAVVTIPLNLEWTLGADFELDATALLIKLVGLVLLPALAGHLLARFAPKAGDALMPLTKLVPTVALGLVIYVSTSKHVEHLAMLTLQMLLFLAVAAIIVHLALLVLGYVAGRGVFGLTQAQSRSVAVVCSEKTLPMAVAVWALTMAHTHPLALLAPLVFHPTQIICDGIIASRWARKAPEQS